MRNFNYITKSMLCALSLAAPAALADSYYVPHRVATLPNGQILHTEVNQYMDINDSGAIVGISSTRKPLYWSRYDSPELLEFPVNRTTDGAYFIDINDQGHIQAASAIGGQFKMAEWTPIDHNLSSFHLPFSPNPEFGRDSSGKILFMQYFGNQGGARDGMIYDPATQAISHTNLYLEFNQNIVSGIGGLNDNGTVVVEGTDPTNTSFGFSAYQTATSGRVAMKGSTPDYNYYSHIHDLNNSGDAIGQIQKFTFNPTGHIFDCLFENIEGQSVRYILSANELFSNQTIYAYCKFMDVNDNRIAIGNGKWARQSAPTIRAPFLFSYDNPVMQPFKDLIHYNTSVTPSDLENLVITKINENNEILGFNQSSNGTVNYYYFTAHSDTPEPPEPPQPPPPPPPPVPPVDIIIDNDDIVGASTSSNWVLIHSTIDFLIPFGTPWRSETTLSGYVGSDYQLSDQSNGNESTFTWSYMVDKQANYHLSVAWPAGAGNDPAATYEIKMGDTPLGTVTIDQRIAATGGYQTLGIYTLAKDSDVTITLKGSGQGNVIADAVHIVEQ